MNTANLMRRRLLNALLLSALPSVARAQATSAEIEVWKSPTCGCCKDWITHLQQSGFRVKVNDSGNNAARARLKMPAQYGSCHTGLVGGYAIEGHVPAREIQRLLREKPAAIGLSVPNMPIGSPGMDSPAYGDRKDPFDVLLVQADASARVCASYGGRSTK